MISIKVKFRPSSVVLKMGCVYYQIIHDRKVRRLPTSYRIFASEWDEDTSMVNCRDCGERLSELLSIREGIRCDIRRLTKIAQRLDNDGLPFSIDDFISEFARYSKDYSLFNYMGNQIAKLIQNNKIRTSETYQSTLNSFKTFRNGEDIMLDCLTSEVMEAYEAWLRGRGVAPNTISFYTRVLRAVYNRAVENDIIDNRHPFRRVYTGIDKTVKRALPLEYIKRLYSLDLSSERRLAYARDMFILSFMLRGMSFIDMAYLRKSDRHNGSVTYRRRKTGQQLTIKWTAEMQRILDKYPPNTSDFLLPIIKRPGTNERYTYRNVGYNINRSLKTIAGLIGIDIPLTMYVARHSWASIAKAKGIPLSVISEGMGHDSETTTQIYLADLDTSVVDRANSLIIRSIR